MLISQCINASLLNTDLLTVSHPITLGRGRQRMQTAETIRLRRVIGRLLKLNPICNRFLSPRCAKFIILTRIFVSVFAEFTVLTGAYFLLLDRYQTRV